MGALKEKKGFTLIELIVSIAIIGIFSLTVFLTLSSSNLISNKNEQREEVISIKTGVADSIKASQNTWKTQSGLKLWLLDNGYRRYYNTNIFYREQTENNVKYSVRLWIKSLDTPKLFEVRITVTSPSVKGTELVTRYYG